MLHSYMKHSSSSSLYFVGYVSQVSDVAYWSLVLDPYYNTITFQAASNSWMRVWLLDQKREMFFRGMQNYNQKPNYQENFSKI